MAEKKEPSPVVSTKDTKGLASVNFKRTVTLETSKIDGDFGQKIHTFVAKPTGNFIEMQALAFSDKGVPLAGPRPQEFQLYETPPGEIVVDVPRLKAMLSNAEIGLGKIEKKLSDSPSPEQTERLLKSRVDFRSMQERYKPILAAAEGLENGSV